MTRDVNPLAGLARDEPGRRMLFVTGTRADFGKLKPLIREIAARPKYHYQIFATGMHMLARYGSTINEIYRSGLDYIFPYVNQDASINTQMDLVLANTIQGLGHFIREFPADLIVVHGDRIETLAGAIVGALSNTLVAHIEGGEVSGTIDELLRHSVTKLSHLHFVANHDHRNRLLQMGEVDESVFVIGSPDIDVMLSDTLPTLDEVRQRYEIPFSEYGILLYHPVTTEIDGLAERAKRVVGAIERTGNNFVVLYPNNDLGSDLIFSAIKSLEGKPQFRILPSMRFEFFLTLLKNSQVLVGNSSSGIREAPVYGVPTVNVGTRQLNRFNYPSIVNVTDDEGAILGALENLPKSVPPSYHFGHGDSAQRFIEALENDYIWHTPRQKHFRDMPRIVHDLLPEWKAPRRTSSGRMSVRP